MALEKCDECNALMSDRAPTCLNCGYPIAAAGDRNTGGTITPQRSGLGRVQDALLAGTFICALALVGMTVIGM